MERLLSLLNRYLPLIFLASSIITLLGHKYLGIGLLILMVAVGLIYLIILLRFWAFVPIALFCLVWLTSKLVDSILVREVIYGLLLIIFFGVFIFVLMGYSGKLPPAYYRRGWVMDILDRLTNKQALTKKIEGEVEVEVIDANALSTALKQKVIAQDSICDDLAAQIRRRMALQQRSKPIGVFLFAGSPGTGKTYLGKMLARELGRKLIHFDMAQANNPMGATVLFGSPKGYMGSETYGKLTSQLRDIPDAVVLLDEIDKAHSEVHKKFLTAWNDGFVTEASDGRQISTVKAIFILTSNAGVEGLDALGSQYKDNSDDMRRSSVNVLKEAGFAPEVLNRIDRIFVFSRLKGLDIARVTALEIEQMIQSYGLGVADQGIDPELLFQMMLRQEKLADVGSSRDLVRSIEETIADSLIDAKQQGALRVELVEKDGAILARPMI
jgi:ATP-dependent Clp protease ATP-binding subunit ClpA